MASDRLAALTPERAKEKNLARKSVPTQLGQKT